MNDLYRFKVIIKHKMGLRPELSWHQWDRSFHHVTQKVETALNNIQKRNVLAQNYEIGEIKYEPEAPEAA